MGEERHVSTRGCRAAGATGLALVALGGAAAAPAHAGPRAFVAVNRIQALPAHAPPGPANRRHGRAANRGGRAASGRVTVRLLHRGRGPRAIGRTTLRVAAHASRRFTVGVRVPAGLEGGSYELTACAPRGMGDWLTCVNGASDLRIDGG